MTVQAPIPDFAAARWAMVESQLRPIGVTDPLVIEAMAEVERERFVPDEARPLAYGDRAVPLGDGRFLPPPSVLGLLLTQMAAGPGERALVVGAGTGYSAAVMARMGLDVVALESSGSPRRARPRAWNRHCRRPARCRLAQGRTVSPHPDRRRNRDDSQPDRRPAGRGRAARNRSSRPIRHPAHRGPQIGRRVWLSFASRCRHSGSPGLRPTACIHILRGVEPSVPKASFRVADRCADGRHRRSGYAARCTRLGLSHQPDADRPARIAKGDRCDRCHRQSRGAALGNRHRRPQPRP